jgi:quercetin dioxygenase-like cupin family protein
MSYVFLPPGAGERHDAGTADIVIKATGEDSGGSFFMAESVIQAGFPGPPLHRHSALHDMFYVLEGTLTLTVGDQQLDAGPGTFVCVPPGTAHTFANRSDAPTRLLNFNTPSGWEHYMRDLAEAGRAAPLTSETIGLIASRYDFEIVPRA